ncbi:MAG: hypothetical protein GY760_13500 [Deltaproteobacteria bacterium]|nr:hypothetical protein [Deltaproteobacteria bacterium]
MIRKTESYWKKHIENWKISELTVHQYCKNNGLVQSTLQRWIKKLDKRIIPIKIDLPEQKNCPNNITIESPGIRISLPDTVDPALLLISIKEIKKCS